MGWAAFFEENSQSIFTLAGVFLGSIITLAISTLNNRFQAKEREKERQLQQHEVKIQLTLELRKKDIEFLDESINETLHITQSMDILSQKRRDGRVSDDELIHELESMMYDERGMLAKLCEIDNIADKIAYSLGEDFYSERETFTQLWGEYAEAVMRSGLLTGGTWIRKMNHPIVCLISSKKIDSKRESDRAASEALKEPYFKLIRQAAKLHNLLREHLVSIREP